MLVRDLQQLGEMIRVTRQQRKLSQTELAERIGATRQWLSRLEQGKNDISAKRLLALVDALELNLELNPPRRHSDPLPMEDTKLDLATVAALNLERVRQDFSVIDPEGTRRIMNSPEYKALLDAGMNSPEYQALLDAATQYNPRLGQ